MIRHWLLIARRTMRQEPVFAAISILSLAIGCAGALLVGAYLREELTWDHWVPDSARMVRLDAVWTYPGQEPRASSGVPSGLAPLLEDAAPGVEALTRTMQDVISARSGGTPVTLFGVFADSNVFDVLKLPFAEADPSTALSDPSGVVISAQTREQLFGEERALGRTLSIGEHEGVVTGVLARLPRNSEFRQQPQFFAPLASPFRPSRAFVPDPDTSFETGNATIYIRADSRARARAWRATLPSIASDILARHSQLPEGASVAFAVTPFRHMRFSDASSGAETTQAVARLELMLGVAGALLFVSAFNHVSLSLARAVRRTREVGVRKAMGATRGDLVRQHLAESALFTLAALALGFALAELSLPWVSRAVDLGVDSSALRHPVFLGAALAGGLVVAALVAAYPAAFRAGLRPASILKGRSGPTRAISAAIFALAAVQFAVAAALATAVAVLYAQAGHLASASLGYETENRVFFAPGPVFLSSALRDGEGRTNLANLRRLEAALAEAPGVLAVTGASLPPLLTMYSDQMVEQFSSRIAAPGVPPEQPALALVVWSDLDYLAALEVAPLAGRLFDETLGSDRVLLDNAEAKPAQLPAIVTETALPLFDAQAPEDALGRRARLFQGSAQNPSEIELEVVGVVPDFHFRSLRHAASPIVFLPHPGGARSFIAHIDGPHRESALAALRAALVGIAPDQPPRMNDLQELEAFQYQEERRWRRLVAGAAALSIAVACLGLHGLTAFSANRSRRELGVRRALGADEGQALRLMLARFARPVIAGIALGWIAAYFALAEWLSGFAHRIALTPAPFLLAGALALAIAGATALAHALRAARTSPAAALREE